MIYVTNPVQPLVINIHCYYNNMTRTWIILTRTKNQSTLREGEMSLRILFHLFRNPTRSERRNKVEFDSFTNSSVKYLLWD